MLGNSFKYAQSNTKHLIVGHSVPNHFSFNSYDTSMIVSARLK